MRSDLLTSPKVVRMSSALGADRFRIAGGLLSVWCLFDTHSEDGCLIGYSEKMLDELAAWSGFSAAMMLVGWLEKDGESLMLPRFEEHNGSSAKRRAQDTNNKRERRQMSARDADKIGTREEKRREDKLISKDINTKGAFSYPDWFDDLWKLYPTRAGSNDKKKAFQAANARLTEGRTQAELFAAVDRYRFFVVATGKVSTEYVKQGATFFGPNDNLDNPWTVPTKSGGNNTPQGGGAIGFTSAQYNNGVDKDGKF
jgi:hypothetical protein